MRDSRGQKEHQRSADASVYAGRLKVVLTTPVLIVAAGCAKRVSKTRALCGSGASSPWSSELSKHQLTCFPGTEATGPEEGGWSLHFGNNDYRKALPKGVFTYPPQLSFCRGRYTCMDR
jgi:hypothetical protein